MEYLMTYGWAIIVIAVVLGAMYSLGIFSSNTLIPTRCVAETGYYCEQPLYSNGNLIVEMGQETGKTWYSATAVFVPDNSSLSGTNPSYAIPGALESGQITNVTIYVGYAPPMQGRLYVRYEFLGSSVQYIAELGDISIRGVPITATTGQSTSTTSTTSTSTISTTTSTTVSTTIAYYYSTLTLTNNQAASAAPFQQMVKFNPSSYSAYEQNGLGNVRFYQGSTELYSWCESGCTNGSSNAIFWVRIPNGVPNGSNTISMRFYQSTNTQYDGTYAGEAPQLSSTYAQYDNGASVFNFYDNFAGSSLRAGWDYIGSYSITQNNGIVIQSSSSGSGGIYWGTAMNPQTNVLEFDAYASTFSSSVQMAWEGAGQTNPQYQIGIDTSNGYYDLFNWNSGSSQDVDMPGGIPGSYALFGLWADNAQSYATFNYGSPYSNNVGFTASTSLYPTLLAYGPDTISLAVQWVRARAYPPSGVMPSVSFGTVQA